MDSKDREQEEVVLRLTAHYVNEVQAGHHPAISDYVARYPQYADAIAAFIAYYQTVELSASQLAGSADLLAITGSSRETVEHAGEFANMFPIAIESAWQRVLTPEGAPASGDVEGIDHMSEIGQHEVVEEVIYGQAIQSFFIAAKQQRLSPSQLAVYLNISEDIVMLLEQRALLPESIPFELYRRLASILHQPMRSVQDYVGMERRQRVAEYSEVYDAGDVGNVGNTPRSCQKVSFREALEKSGALSAEQKSYWHDVLMHEGV